MLTLFLALLNMFLGIFDIFVCWFFFFTFFPFLSNLCLSPLLLSSLCLLFIFPVCHVACTFFLLFIFIDPGTFFLRTDTFSYSGLVSGENILSSLPPNIPETCSSHSVSGTRQNLACPHYLQEQTCYCWNRQKDDD